MGICLACSPTTESLFRKMSRDGSKENLSTSAASLHNNKSLFIQHECRLKNRPNLRQRPNINDPRSLVPGAERGLFCGSQNQQPGWFRFSAVTSTMCIIQQ